MALEALWVQGSTYPARVDRLLIESLLTEGVLNVAGGELLVRQRAAGANMTVEIDPGRVAITGDDQANQGRYLCRSTAVEGRTVNAAPVSGSRIDLVVARVADASVTGVVNGLLLEVIAGTPHATTPVIPATPNGAVPLARIAVASGQVSVVNANITDLRPKAALADTNAAYVSLLGENADGFRSTRLRQQSQFVLTQETTTSTAYAALPTPVEVEFVVPPSERVTITIRGTLSNSAAGVDTFLSFELFDVTANALNFGATDDNAISNRGQNTVSAGAAIPLTIAPGTAGRTFRARLRHRVSGASTGTYNRRQIAVTPSL